MSANQISEQTAYEMDVVSLFMQNIDVIAMINQFGGIEDYIELLALFETNGERQITLLNDLKSNRDLENYTIEVHGLKSASANIGAGQLSSLAKRHEEAGKASDTAFIDENFSSLIDLYQATLTEIQRVLKQRGYGRFAEVDTSSLPPIDADSLNEKLHAALQHLESFKSKEAAHELEDLMSFAIPDDTREQLKQMSSLLDIYEDEQAEDMLRALMDEQ